MSDALKYEDLFNNIVVLVSKKDQIAVIEEHNDKLMLNVLAGKSYEISSKTAHQYFDLIYLDDMCFETKQKLLKKIGK